MRKQILLILSILGLSSILRFYNLGSIPSGLSLTEINFGLWLSRFGNWALNPVVIRLPFALIGIISVYIFYLLVKKLFDNQTLALVSAVILGIIPWHVQESRIFSWGMILFLAGELITLFVLRFFRGWFEKLTKHNLCLGIILFVVCIIIPIPGLGVRVDTDRLAVVQVSPKLISRVFINKVVENYREREQVLFTNLDFGNYFFVGHPRERGGIEETQKLLLFMLPFMIWGLIKIGSEKGKFIITWTIVSLFILTIFNLQESQTLILILPFIVLTAVGILDLLKLKNNLVKIFVILVFTFGLFETLSFYSLYFSGYTESQFSPRRPIYINLSKELLKVKRSNETVLINDRLGDPKEFLSFYLDKNLSGYEFRSFNYHMEKNRGGLFVDVLPDDPISDEPLYTKDGSYPSDITVVAAFYDASRRQKVVLYRMK